MTTIGRSLAERLREGRIPASGPVTLVLPLPDKACNPNARCHWAVKARAVKSLRAAAFAEAAATKVYFKHPVISAVFYHRTRRTRDRDNAIASIKGVDGLADAGLFSNDSLVHWGSVTFDVDKVNPRVVLTITEGE